MESPKDFLQHWDRFFSEEPALGLQRAFSRSDAAFQADLILFLSQAVRGSRGILRARAKYSQKNKSTSRPFTSLSETVTACLRNIWRFAVGIPHLGLLLAIAKNNALDAVLPNAGLLELLEATCWARLDAEPAAFLLAVEAAKCMQAGHLDNALAMRYVSARQAADHPQSLWVFFRLIDPDAPEFVLVALDALPKGPPVLGSVRHLMDMYRDAPAITGFLMRAHVLPSMLAPLDAVTVGDILHICQSHPRADSLDATVDFLARTAGLHALADLWLQLVGTLLGPNCPVQVGPAAYGRLRALLLQAEWAPRLVWAVANLCAAAQPSPSEADTIDAIVLRALESEDDGVLSSAVRILGGLRRADLLFALAPWASEAPKVMWTIANTLASLPGPLPDAVLGHVVAWYEATPNYKVAIACAQALAAHPAQLPAHGARIRAALAGQRFSIRDAYSEQYTQALKRANAELLWALDRRPWQLNLDGCGLVKL